VRGERGSTTIQSVHTHSLSHAYTHTHTYTLTHVFIHPCTQHVRTSAPTHTPLTLIRFAHNPPLSISRQRNISTEANNMHTRKQTCTRPSPARAQHSPNCGAAGSPADRWCGPPQRTWDLHALRGESKAVSGEQQRKQASKETHELASQRSCAIRTVERSLQLTGVHQLFD
jgi:hypothetical protein